MSKKKKQQKLFPFLLCFIEITFFEVSWLKTEKLHNIDRHERRHYKNLNIHLLLMKCTGEFNFGIIIHHF